MLGDWYEERGLTPEAWLLRVAQQSDTDDTDVTSIEASEGTNTAESNDDYVPEEDDACLENSRAVMAADGVDTSADPKGNLRQFWTPSELREGLLLIQVPGRDWGVTRVGWARRVEGDEWEFIGVSIARISTVRSLDDLAANGPGTDHRVSDVDLLPELLHSLSPRRVLTASETAWGQYVPKPEGW